MEREADVVIVGGGIVGCATAYYLAKRGVRAVLLEKGEVADEQSGRNWGWVRQQGRHRWEMPLSMATHQIWQGLEEELGADVEWVQGGQLTLAADERRMETIEEWHGLAVEHGLDARLLTNAEAKALIPSMEGSWLGGLYTPGDGQADPKKATGAFARAAVENGARLYTQCAAEGIAVRNGAVHAVRTTQGEIRTARVVNAAGAWASRLARAVGVKLPQRAVRSTAAATKPTAPLTPIATWADGVAFRQDTAGRFILARGLSSDYDVTLEAVRDLHQFLPGAWTARTHLRPRLGRPFFRHLRTLIPGTAARRDPFTYLGAYEPPPNQAKVRAALRRFRELFPALAGLELERVWAGYIEGTPDRVPVLCEVERPRGFLIATGFSGHGFVMGPVAGKMMSELIVDGRPSLDLHRFRLSRFAEGDLAQHREVF